MGRDREPGELFEDPVEPAGAVLAVEAGEEELAAAEGTIVTGGVLRS